MENITVSPKYIAKHTLAICEMSQFIVIFRICIFLLLVHRLDKREINCIYKNVYIYNITYTKRNLHFGQEIE